MTHDDSVGGVRIRLFDADRTDRELTLEEALAAKVSARQLLWVDLVGEADREELRTLARRFDLDVATERSLAAPASRPLVELHGKHFHLRVAAEPDPARPEDIDWLDLVAAHWPAREQANCLRSWSESVGASGDCAGSWPRTASCSPRSGDQISGVLSPQPITRCSSP